MDTKRKRILRRSAIALVVTLVAGGALGGPCSYGGAQPGSQGLRIVCEGPTYTHTMTSIEATTADMQSVPIDCVHVPPVHHEHVSPRVGTYTLKWAFLEDCGGGACAGFHHPGLSTPFHVAPGQYATVTLPW